MLNKAKKSFGFRNVWNLMDEFPLWLKVPQNLQSLEIKQKWLVSSYGKIWDLNSCFVLLFSLLIFLGRNYLRRQFFTCKFYYFVFIQRYCAFNILLWFDFYKKKIIFSREPIWPYTFYTFYTFNFERYLSILFPERTILYYFLLK